MGFRFRDQGLIEVVEGADFAIYKLSASAGYGMLRSVRAVRVKCLGFNFLSLADVCKGFGSTAQWYNKTDQDSGIAFDGCGIHKFALKP